MNQISGSILIGVLMMGSPAFASSKLVKEKQCMQCHAVSKDTIGPSFKNIAKRWKGKEDAEKTLFDISERKILQQQVSAVLDRTDSRQSNFAGK